MQITSPMVTCNASNPLWLLASKFSNRCSAQSFYVDISWGQWGINHGAPAPGPLRLGALKVENEKVVLMFC